VPSLSRPFRSRSASAFAASVVLAFLGHGRAALCDRDRGDQGRNLSVSDHMSSPLVRA